VLAQLVEGAGPHQCLEMRAAVERLPGGGIVLPPAMHDRQERPQTITHGQGGGGRHGLRQANEALPSELGYLRVGQHPSTLPASTGAAM
jgi:hypothetical protein